MQSGLSFLFNEKVDTVHTQRYGVIGTDFEKTGYKKGRQPGEYKPLVLRNDRDQTD